MRVHYTGKVGHGTVTHFRLKTLLNLCAFAKFLSNSNKMLLPILVVTYITTLQLYGMLNHTIFCRLFLLRLTSLFSESGWNLILWTNPLLEKVLLINSLELLKTVLSDDNLFIRREILLGRFFMLGGWLEYTLIYNGLLSGLLYGSYLSVDRFSVKSRKLATLRFVSLTMLRLNSFLNNLRNYFLILSSSRPLVFWKQTKPSSLYKLILSFPYFSSNLCRIYRLTTSPISAPKLPIVTSKSWSPSFFIHTPVPLKRRDFLECIMVFVSPSLILTKSFL